MILLALAATGGVTTYRFWIALVSQCLFLYPASHAFNSYYDRDEGPIAGLPRPPAVDKHLLYAAFALDAAAIALGFTLGLTYVAWLLAYGFASKAYSHPWTRWKAQPWIGWMVVSLFQGGLTFLFTVQAITGVPLLSIVGEPYYLALAMFSTGCTAAFYPVTQVYQHDEDGRRGDITLSRRLGIRATWAFAAIGAGLSFALLLGIAISFERWGLFTAMVAGSLVSLPALPKGAERLNPNWSSISRLSWASATGYNLSLIFYCGVSR